MKTTHSDFYESIIRNISKVMRDRNLTQAYMAELAGVSVSQFSKVVNFQVTMSIDQLSSLALGLGMEPIELISYGETRAASEETNDEDHAEVLLQLKLKKEKKDQVLKLVFGENNIEILNR